MSPTQSEVIHQRALQLMPGGVSSPVRAFTAVGGSPLVMARGAGSRIWDVDGREYIDYVMSFGPLIAGHAHPQVVEAITRTAANGATFGASSELESDLAQAIVDSVPSIEMARFVSSGTEAAGSAVRLARAATGRQRIVKFAGCYHGHTDGMLVAAGSGGLTFGVPDSPGVPAAVAALTMIAPYNDDHALSAIFEACGEEIAAVIVEPLAANAGVIPPRDGFLRFVRELTLDHGALLIFDEVITGFRLAPGGAQQFYGTPPDLTCLGKIIGGGLPVGAYGGSRALMNQVAPAGPVYQAGTLSGNPVAMAAGLATLRLVTQPGAYDLLAARGAWLADGLRAAAATAGVAVQVNQVASLLSVFFTDQPVTTLAEAERTDRAAYAAFFHAMLAEGVYLPPSPFEAYFLSLAHDEGDIERTVAAAGRAFAVARSSRQEPHA